MPILRAETYLSSEAARVDLKSYLSETERSAAIALQFQVSYRIPKKSSESF
jgi:hypothetical protein